MMRTSDEEMRTVDNDLFDYSPIVGREPIRWPGGARGAFYVGLNVEHFLLDRPSTSLNEATAALVPDPLNYGWRDYGPRVGIWRLVESLDRHGMRASVLLNSEVPDRYPQLVEAGRARDWAWLAHGRNNSTLQADMPADEERAYLTDVVDTIEKATGHRPRGWLGPALTETFRTPELHAELGSSYVLDWTNDDQPYRMNVPGMLSVPYSVEVNDLGLFMMKGLSGPGLVQVVKDQLDQLYADSAGSGRVMALALHPFVVGQPSRHKYLDQALEYVANHPGVWLTTSDEIAEHYAHATSEEAAGRRRAPTGTDHQNTEDLIRGRPGGFACQARSSVGEAREHFTKEVLMIGRIWYGWTRSENADMYEQLLKKEIFPGIADKKVPGYKGIQLFRRPLGNDEVEFVTIMSFDSWEAVKRFSGEDYERAYVPPKAKEVLARFEEHSRHYEVREHLAYRL